MNGSTRPSVERKGAAERCSSYRYPGKVGEQGCVLGAHTFDEIATCKPERVVACCLQLRQLFAEASKTRREQVDMAAFWPNIFADHAIAVLVRKWRYSPLASFRQWPFLLPDRPLCRSLGFHDF